MLGEGRNPRVLQVIVGGFVDSGMDLYVCLQIDMRR